MAEAMGEKTGITRVKIPVLVDKAPSSALSNETLDADLAIPNNSQAIVLFAHGAGSGRYSLRNQYVAQFLNQAGIATLLVDLLTEKEKLIDNQTRKLRFNIDLLSDRFRTVTKWLFQNPMTSSLSLGYFGSSTGAAAAFIVASENNDVVKAIISRGGRPDLAPSKALQKISCPTLLIVGRKDQSLIKLNNQTLQQLIQVSSKEIAVIPGASHLFEEPGKMEEVAKISVQWFEYHLLNRGKKFENTYSHKGALSFPFLKTNTRINIRFKDRISAGEMLASVLAKYKNRSAIVIAIPRGGIIVADVIARKLVADMDIVIPRKMRSPFNSENAIGALMQDGSEYLNSNLVESLEISKEYLEMEKVQQRREIARRMGLYRPDAREYNIKGRTVILVDDGAATGATIITAARWIRKQNPDRLIIALPITSKQTMELLKNEADDIEVLKSSSNFSAVAHFYENFDEVSDDQVIQLLVSYKKQQ